MQHPFPSRHARKTGRRVPTVLAAAAVVGGIAAGCSGPATPPASTGPAQSPFAGVSLTVACGDPGVARALAGRAAAWAGKTGATVRVEAKPPAADSVADVAVIRPAELGEWAARGEVAVLPAELRAPDQPLQWGRIVPAYRSNLAGWGPEPHGLPVAGDGYALVYRADKFAADAHRQGFARAYQGRSLEPPATWEDVADVAGYFAAADKAPSLPPLPADPVRLATTFQQVAACYDRKALTDAEKGGGEAGGGTSFQIQAGTWEPRLAAPGFVAAAEWLARTQSYRAPADGPRGDDPVRALDGTAVVAVLSLAEIGRLPKDPGGAVATRFRVAPLPGTRVYLDGAVRRPAGARLGNYVPFFGSGGGVAVVFKRSPHQPAAWALLADLAGAAGSLAALGAPGSGIGPFRTEHTDPARDDVWLGYGFDAAGTKELAAAMRHYLAAEVTVPALTLRTPDQAAVTTILAGQVRAAATGRVAPAEAMAQADRAWKALDASRPRDEVVRWRRNAVGLP